MQYVQNIKAMNAIVAAAAAASNTGRLFSMPEKMILVPLLRCNFQCVTCSQDHSCRDELPESCLEKLEPVFPFIKMVNITGGEPLMYKGITRLLALLGQYEIDIMFGTNGSLLSEARRREIMDAQVRWLKFSIDGGTPEAYNRIRTNGNFFKVMRNVGEMAKLRLVCGSRNPEMQFNFVGLKSNIGSLKNLVPLAAELGVAQINVIYCVCWNDVLSADSLFFHQEYSDTQMMLAAEIGRRLGVNVALPELFSEKKQRVQEKSWLNTSRCDEPFRNISITTQGQAGICCGYGGRFGDLTTESFDELWNHPKWVRIRETVNTDNESTICKNCTANKQKSRNYKSHFSTRELYEKACAAHGVAPERQEA